MRTYYRDHDASVTDEAFIRHTWSPKTFPIHELYDVVMVVPSAFSVARRRPRRWELRARYRGNDVVLYTSTNVTTFGQVSRALRRALEKSGPRAYGYDLAS